MPCTRRRFWPDTIQGKTPDSTDRIWLTVGGLHIVLRLYILAPSYSTSGLRNGLLRYRFRPISASDLLLQVTLCQLYPAPLICLPALRFYYEISGLCILGSSEIRIVSCPRKNGLRGVRACRRRPVPAESVEAFSIRSPRMLRKESFTKLPSDLIRWLQELQLTYLPPPSHISMEPLLLPMSELRYSALRATGMFLFA